MEARLLWFIYGRLHYCLVKYEILCFSAFLCHWQGVEKTSRRVGNIHYYSPALAYPGVVSGGPSPTSCTPSASSTRALISSARPISCTSAGSKVNSYSYDALGRSFESRGISPEVAEFLLHSWRDGTKLQYGSHVQRWMSFCIRRKVDPFQPSINFLLDYLLQEFRKEKGRSYSSMNTIRSAISSISYIDDKPAGKHPLVSRLMRAVFQQRPSFSRCQSIWDPDLILNYIKSLSLNEN